MRPESTPPAAGRNASAERLPRRSAALPGELFGKGLFRRLWRGVLPVFGSLFISAAAAIADAPVPLLVDARQGEYPLARTLLYLKDPGKKLSVEQVAALPRERFSQASTDGSEVNFGISSSGYWLAIPLMLAADAPSNWLLQIAYAALDRVEVYVRRPGLGFVRQTSGDLQTFSTRPFDHRHFVFPVTLNPGTAQTLYLRVESEGSLTVPATLWQPSALASRDRRSYSALSLYYGLLLALALFNLMIWLSSRETLFLAYVGTVLCLALGVSSIDGLANQFLWPTLPVLGNAALLFGLAGAGFFSTVFTRCFLGTREASPLLDRAILAFSAVFIVAGLSPLVLPYAWGAILTALAAPLFAALAVSSAARRQTRDLPGMRWFLLSWVLVFASVTVFALRIVGWLPTNDFTLHAMHVGAGLLAALLSCALAARISATRREREQAQFDAIKARETMVETLRQSEHRLEVRVAERTRELDLANSQLRENQQQLERMARYDPLTGLANRLLLEDRISQAVVRARRSGRGAAVLLIDLDGFKMVNDTRGHAVGDQVLKELARRYTDAVREADTVARLGGDEFVVLLEDLDGPGDAVAVAEKLVAETREPFMPDSGGLALLSASIGIAYCPKDGSDTDTLLRCADEAMYAVKAAGRNGLKAFATGQSAPA